MLFIKINLVTLIAGILAPYIFGLPIILGLILAGLSFGALSPDITINLFFIPFLTAYYLSWLLITKKLLKKQGWSSPGTALIAASSMSIQTILTLSQFGPIDYSIEFVLPMFLVIFNCILLCFYHFYKPVPSNQSFVNNAVVLFSVITLVIHFLLHYF